MLKTMSAVFLESTMGTKRDVNRVDYKYAIGHILCEVPRPLDATIDYARLLLFGASTSLVIFLGPAVFHNVSLSGGAFLDCSMSHCETQNNLGQEI
jgi:hypothetical protein